LEKKIKKKNKKEIIKNIEKKLNKSIGIYKQCLENIKKELKNKLISQSYTHNEIEEEINLLETKKINCSEYKKIQKILNDTLQCVDISKLSLAELILVLICYKNSIDDITNIKEKSIKYIKEKNEQKNEELSLATDIKLLTETTNFDNKKIKDYQYQDYRIRYFIQKIKEFNGSSDIKEEYLDFIAKIIEYNLKYLDYLTNEYNNINKEKVKINNKKTKT